ncbi:MAG: EamA family transporter [Patescibacteria group bacterium]|nr:EamA family transporter [Patescibacteria group bacterium]
MSLSVIPWQVLVVTGAILTSVGQIFNKHQVHKAASFQVQIYKYLSGTVLMTYFWMINNGVLPKIWWLLLIYGISIGFIVVLYTKASRYSLSKSVVTMPISQILGVGLAAGILKEWQIFKISSMAGKQMLLALLLVPVILYLFYEKTKSVKQWSILIWIVIVWLALVKVFQKHILTNIEPIQLIAFQYWGSLLMALIGSKVRGHKLYLGKRFALTGLIQGVFTSTAVFLYFSGLKQSTVSQTTLLRMPVFLVLTTCFGLFIFKEIKEMTFKKWAGMGLAILMTVLVITANY